MSMTKQDFIRIARALYASRPPYNGPTPEQWQINAAKRAHHRIVVSHIMRELEASNPRFDQEKFLKAVYPIEEGS